MWDSVNVNGELVGLPQDTGPMALFYNKTIFDKYGLTVPTTWAQYVADAKKLHAANPKEYITNDTGDPGFTTSMIWAAGGHPYVTSGTKNVTIDLCRPGHAEVREPVEPAGLRRPGRADPARGAPSGTPVCPTGRIASLVTGGWMGVDLETGVPTGKRRLAGRPDARSGPRATERRLGERRQLGRGARREQEPGRRGRVPAVDQHRPGRAALRVDR